MASFTGSASEKCVARLNIPTLNAFSQLKYLKNRVTNVAIGVIVDYISERLGKCTKSILVYFLPSKSFGQRKCASAVLVVGVGDIR